MGWDLLGQEANVRNLLQGRQGAQEGKKAQEGAQEEEERVELEQQQQ
jgi:hypothetical protein